MRQLHDYSDFRVISIVIVESLQEKTMASYFISKTTLKNKEVRYRAVITESGKNIKSKTFRRRTDAKAWGTRFVLAREEQTATGELPCTVTFSTLVEEYLQAWTGKDHDRVRMVLIWEDIFKDILLSDITPELIRKSLKPKRDRAPATFNRHKAVLASLFKFAIAQHQDDENDQIYICKNPCSEIQTLTENNKRIRFLTKEEKPRLIEAAKTIGGKFYLCVFMALTTGMRKGELINLSWSDIDFEKGLAILSDTKNGSERHTPIPNVAMDILMQYRKIGNGLIFPSTANSSKPFDFRKKWLACLKDANITDFRWHDMRHDTASTLARDGKSLKEIAEILGHKSLVSTDRYTHLCTEHKSQLLNDTMNKAFNL